VLDGRDVPTRVTASTWTVTNNLDSGAGSLRAEIAAANPGDAIVFAPGLGPTIQLTSDELFINKSLTIQGPGAGLLAISGGNAWRVFEVRGAGTNVTLSGLTITQGSANALNSNYGGDGGGITNDNGSTLTISGCTVSGNRAYSAGGGVYNFGATLQVINSTLSGNTVQDPISGAGGAVYSVIGGSAYQVSLTGCTLSNNSAAAAGGAIYDVNTTMAVSGCTLSANSAGVEGSAIYGNGTMTLRNGRTVPTLTVSNSAFSGNSITEPPYNRYPSSPIDGYWIDGGGNTFS
jgi:predicted outer membrane repeat protein